MKIILSLLVAGVTMFIITNVIDKPNGVIVGFGMIAFISAMGGIQD